MRQVKKKSFFDNVATEKEPQIPQSMSGRPTPGPGRGVSLDEPRWRVRALSRTPALPSEPRKPWSPSSWYGILVTPEEGLTGVFIVAS